MVGIVALVLKQLERCLANPTPLVQVKLGAPALIKPTLDIVPNLLAEIGMNSQWMKLRPMIGVKQGNGICPRGHARRSMLNRWLPFVQQKRGAVVYAKGK